MSIFGKLIIVGTLIAQLSVEGAAAPKACLAVKSDSKKAVLFNAAIRQKMLDAIKSYDVKKLSSILQKGKVCINTSTDLTHANTPLALAVIHSCQPAKMKDKIAIVKLLLTHKADPTIGSQMGVGHHSYPMFPLDWALDRYYGCSDLVEIFLSFDPKLINTLYAGCSPLDRVLTPLPSATEEPKASLDERLKLVKMLLSYGADTTLISSDDRSALEQAEQNANPEFAKIIRKHNDEKREKIVTQIKATRELTDFPPGLLPIVAGYVQ